MEQRTNKTIMCSVLFLDIVEYSKESVSGQIALKDGFNSFLADAIRDVPASDRIILDTGDGAAISFMGDVEDALKAALILREKLLSEGVHIDPPLLVRMGINLGPVRLVKDINGQPNIVGDGINVAQRVMGFSDPGQILVSRSYYDAVSRLSTEYAGMFHYQGSRTDKHVREHEVYAIGHPGDVIATQPKPDDKGAPETAENLSAAQRVNGWIQAARSTFQNASNQQRALYVATLAGALLLLIVVAIKIMHRPAAPLPPVAEAPVPVVVQTPVPAVAQAASKVAAVPPNAAAAPPKIAVPITEKKPKAVLPAQEKPRRASAAQEKASKDISTTRTLEETTAVEPGAAALVGVAVTPWGEIYLDGRMQGVSPPLAELNVAPGTHEIEIRNTTFPAYTQSIHVKAGEQIKIKHKFAN
ncbi:MAG: adenylate/guanylate cyclase domain-containing protein [Nitrosomonadales bacterium]|nr:adenylate/guanylate cyclase domain-containing protein [Nitrosomonadales bacterium]